MAGRGARLGQLPRSAVVVDPLSEATVASAFDHRTFVPPLCAPCAPAPCIASRISTGTRGSNSDPVSSSSFSSSSASAAACSSSSSSSSSPASSSSYPEHYASFLCANTSSPCHAPKRKLSPVDVSDESDFRRNCVCDSECQVLHDAGERERRDGDRDGYPCHPLHHAAMVAIDLVAKRDLALHPTPTNDEESKGRLCCGPSSHYFCLPSPLLFSLVA